MIQINPLKSYIDGGVRAALTTPPSASLVFDLPGKAIWVKGVKLKGTDHTYTFSHDNYITLTNTPDSNESEDIKIGVNTSALKSAIDTTYGVVSTTANGLAPKFTSGNKLAATAAITYYFLGWAGSTLKWYQAPFRNIRINSETTDRLGVNSTDPLIISSGNGISVTWDSTNKKIVITNTKPDVNHNTDRTGIKLATVSGTKKTDSTLILANSTSGLNIQGGTNKFLIGDGTNYIEVPIVPSISNKDATIGTSLTTIATIAGVDIKAKIASYSLSNHTHSVKINGSTKTIAASGAVDLGNYLPLSGGTMTGVITLTSGSSSAYDKTALSFIKNTDKTELARIGTNSSNGFGLYANGIIYIRPNITFGNNSSNGLVISSSSFTYNGIDVSLSGHTHAWNSLTHSSTTENQAILTNGTANGWKLYTLNISGWNNAANNAHSHSNKSVLDGITSTLVSNWNTAYNFVNTITGTDTDKVINKWDEIVNFLAGITEDDKLNTLLNSKLSVYKLADNTDVGAIKNNGIYYSTSDASSDTLLNSPFSNSFTLINMTSYDGGDDLRRSRLAFNAYGEVKVSNDRGLANTAETWYNILTSKNTYISENKGYINGTQITYVNNSGNATNATNARKLVNWYSTRPTSLNTQFGDGSLRIFHATASTTEGKSPNDAAILHLSWDNNGGWDTQLGISPPSGRVYSRGQNKGTWLSWKTLAFTTDIPTSLKNPYSFNVFGVTYDGSATKTVTTSTFISLVTEGTTTVTDGTMFVTSFASDSGFADTNAVNVPYKRKAIHLWEYIKVKTDSLYATKSHNHDNKYLRWLGNAGQSNMNAIGRISHSSGMTNLSDPGNTIDNPMEGSSKSTSWHLYWLTNYTDDPSGSNAWIALIVNRAGTDRWWVRSRSGGTITNGTNWTSNWRFLVTAPTSGLGNGNLPVYINSAGEVVAANNYPTSLKNPHSLTLKANGTTLATYDGSSTKEVNFTYTNVGAASASHNHDGRYVLASGTINDNIDTDWGLSFKTFDPIPSGTPPELNPNISLLSIGNNFNRRKLLAFTYNNDNIYYRRHTEGGFSNWRRIAFANEIPTSLKNPYALTISLNGTSLGAYDGSAAKSINITPSSIGAAISGHNHDYLIVNAADEESFNSSYHNFLVLYAGGNNGITGRPPGVNAFGLIKFRTAWGWSGQILLANGGNLYIRSSEDTNMTSTLAWRTILDSSNYSSILDSRYYTESEVNNLLSNKLNISNFNWTNLSGKLVAGNEFNIVNDGFNAGMWFNYVPINDRSKTATITGYHFGNGLQGYAPILASGFVKTGSSSSYVLLGNGGHKAISDFATSGHNHNNSYVASVSISGNNLRINKNGVNTDLIIPYATNTDKVDGYHEYDFSHSWRANAYLYTKFITITRSNEKGFIRLHCTVEDNSGIKGADYIVHWLYDGSSENKSITIKCLSSYGSNADTSVYAVRKSGTLFDLIFKALSTGAFYVGFSVISYSSSCTINNYSIVGYTEETKPQAAYTSSAMSLITDITGNASTATVASKLGTSTIGATNVPIYLNSGTPTVVNLNSTANNLINNLSVGDSIPADNDYYIAQYVNGGTTNTTYYRRSHLLFYKYIKGKAEGTWNISINGSAKGLSNNGVLDSQEKIDNFLTANRLEYATFKTTESNNVGLHGNDGMILSIPWSSTSYGAQIAFDDNTSSTVKVRAKNNSWGNWYTLLHSGNSSVSGGGSTWGSSITVNINGTSKTLTIPGNPNTDYRVTQSETTTANYRPLVIGYTNVSTAGSGMTGSVTNQVYLSNKFYVQPSTGNLYATNFVGALSGNASSATKLQTARTIWGQNFNGTGNVNGTFYFTNGDATMKIYGVESTDSSYGNERVAIQTSFDGQDPLTSNYPSTYPTRSALLLQPRGGYIGIGTTLPTYKLHVAGDIYTTTGFKKNGSSDSYVLLGGGGHKAISDFMLKTDELSNNLTTISKSLTVTQAWMDTGIKYADLPANGTYIIQVSASNPTDAIWSNYWSGIMSWYRDSTNDSEADEIILHRAGHAYHHTIYLRTIMTTSSDGRHLRLQIAADTNLSTAVTYTFKFKRVI